MRDGRRLGPDASPSTVPEMKGEGTADERASVVSGGWHAHDRSPPTQTIITAPRLYPPGYAMTTQYNRRSFIKASGAAGTVGLTGLSGCLGSIGGGDLPTVAMGWVVPVENIGSMMDIPDVQEQLPNHGDAYEFESVHHSSTPEGVSSLASGETDVTLVTTVSYANTIEEEVVPGGVQAVLTDFWDAYPEKFGFNIFADPDAGIEEPADFAGKQLGVNATGTSVHAVIVKGLVDSGIDPEADVEFVELGFPPLIQAINDGRIDAAIFPSLFALQAAGEGFDLVFTSHDFWEPYPCGYAIVPNSVLDEKGEAVSAFVEDYLFTWEWMQDNRSEAVSLGADHFDLPEEGLDAIVATDNDYYRGDMSMDIDALNQVMDVLVDLGFTSSSRDYSEYATNDYRP